MTYARRPPAKGVASLNPAFDRRRSQDALAFRFLFRNVDIIPFSRCSCAVQSTSRNRESSV